jgi:hypothetical protein
VTTTSCYFAHPAVTPSFLRPNIYSNNFTLFVTQIKQAKFQTHTKLKKKLFRQLQGRIRVRTP